MAQKGFCEIQYISCQPTRIFVDFAVQLMKDTDDIKDRLKNQIKDTPNQGDGQILSNQGASTDKASHLKKSGKEAKTNQEGKMS
ncbi:hypothetical protein H5410_050407 [Solanum commersonii]|uniref:Uncharacterized protein n=1 Tax=Solanum commersonii TaxID=4109 RepID=A0A9J5WXI4_SOLCO|nr:hypothetical protein H5410_050407 [Solanum commersonii]